LNIDPRRILLPILPIHLYDEAVLRKKARAVRKVDDELMTLIHGMFDTMHNANGIGLAANQVGSLRRVIVIDIAEINKKEDATAETVPQKPMVLLNPEVLAEEGEWIMEEGCLSIPEIREEVDRPQSIRVKYNDLEFNDLELEAHGLLSRVLLHEIDHINGVLFIDRLNLVKRKLLRGRLNKIRRGEVEVSYPIVSPSATGIAAK
jgi:peptide deformylase